MTTSLSVDIAGLAADVRSGLGRTGQKELPSKYFYDALGSRLFDVICELDEYGLTRADERLLRDHSAEMVDRLSGDLILCELGSGSGKKTRWILEAMSRRGPAHYYPIEISPAALALCERELSDIPQIAIVGLENEYLEGLSEVVRRRRAGQRILVLFLGSTIGNFSHPADRQFLAALREILAPGDGLLLGTDLEKPIAQMVEAYDDALGVTAAFNLNLLQRINRELGADFSLRRYYHEARFNEATRSIEMHIVSMAEQRVIIPGANCSVFFHEGETIWTENSHKYTLPEVDSLAAATGFSIEGQWIDRLWPFAETMLLAA
jgi:L-histidine Nalpha-methyltransferase